MENFSTHHFTIHMVDISVISNQFRHCIQSVSTSSLVTDY